MKPFAPQSPMNLALQALVEGNFQEKWEVAKVIPGFGQEAIAPLAELLEHPDSELRWFAARILGEIDHPQGMEMLVELLASPEEELQAIASTSLAKSGKKNISILIPLLRNKLDHPSSRRLAVQALSQIHSEETIAPLLSVVADEDVLVRTRAIAALHSYTAPEILPVFRQGLSDVAASVRGESIAGLGLVASRSLAQFDVYGLNAQELVEILSPCLADSFPEVAQQTAIALRRVGTEAAVVSLGEFLLKNLSSNALASSDNLELNINRLNLQIEILRQLGWIGQPLALDYLEQMLHRNVPELWLEIVMILGRIETSQPQACEILIKMLEPAHPGMARVEIRQALASSLGQLKEPAGRLALSQLLQDSDRSVQLHSQFALGLLLSDRP